MESLVKSLHAEEVGRRTRGRNGALGLPGECRSVVSTDCYCAFPNVKGVGQHIFLNDGG
jgi:hypothetical protein